MRRLTQLSPKRNEKREHSSVGSERLPYKQRVGGSTPSAPTCDCFFQNLIIRKKYSGPKGLYAGKIS